MIASKMIVPWRDRHGRCPAVEGGGARGELHFRHGAMASRDCWAIRTAIRSAAWWTCWKSVRCWRISPQPVRRRERRVALGRALLSGPELLLMDEPLAALDARLRDRLLRYLQRAVQEWQIPRVFVTHSQAEVRMAAQWVIALDRGRVVATGTPDAALGRSETMAWTARRPRSTSYGWIVASGERTASSGRRRAGLTLPLDDAVENGDMTDFCEAPSVPSGKSVVSPFPPGRVPAIRAISRPRT